MSFSKQHQRRNIFNIAKNISQNIDQINNEVIKTFSVFLKQHPDIKTVGLYYPSREQSFEINLEPLLSLFKQHQLNLAFPCTLPANNNLKFFQLSNWDEKLFQTATLWTKHDDYAIFEPNQLNSNWKEVLNKQQLDLIIVPLVAFNDVNNIFFRLGRGKGYYDRFLIDFLHQKIAIAHAWQQVAFQHDEKLDVPLDKVFVIPSN